MRLLRLSGIDAIAGLGSDVITAAKARFGRFFCR